MHSQEKKTVNATVRLDEDDWEAIKNKAKALGTKSRTEFLKAIARGYKEARKTLSTEEKQVLENFKPVERIAAFSPGLRGSTRRKASEQIKSSKRASHYCNKSNE